MPGGNSETGMEIWRTSDGATWEKLGPDGLGDSNNSVAYWDNSVTVFDNALQIGTVNWANGGEVWKYELEITPAFVDVPFSHWAWGYIEAFYDQGITTGCIASPLTYCLNDNVTRAEMAVFLERAMGTSVPPVVPITFTDTPEHWAQYWIEKFKSDGITTGCGLGIYCPNDYVTRAEMAVFIERAMGTFVPPAVPLTFTDTTGHWAQYWIEKFRADGITTGCGPDIYCPDNYVTRAEMAVFITRAFGYTVPAGP